jgi:hypothetical protein
MLPEPPWTDEQTEEFYYHLWPEDLPKLAQEYEAQGRKGDVERVLQLIEKRKKDPSRRIY